MHLQRPLTSAWKPAGHMVCLVACFMACSIMLFSQPAQAQSQGLPTSLLKNPELHCGHTPTLDIIQDLEDNAREYNEDPMLGARYTLGTLLLVLHFEAGSAKIPTECQQKLQQLAKAAQAGQHSPLILRSSTQTNSSTELDLAIANQRLDAVYQMLRKLRVPRKNLLVELHAQAVNPLLDEGLSTPRLVEIYSKPSN